jgi:2-haloacid dehalogenase
MNIDFNSFEVLIFDCYGTIIDWETGILSSLKPILHNHNIQLSDNEILEFYAKTESEIEAGVYQNYNSILKNVLLEFGSKYNFVPSKNELENFSYSIKDWLPFPDSTEALLKLQKKFKLAILSNVDDDLFEYSKEKIGVSFHKVFTAEQIGSYKPALKNFRYAIDNLKYPEEKILHVAQSLYHDILPAKKLGLTTVWVNRRREKDGFGATPPVDAKPDFEVGNLASLALLV